MLEANTRVPCVVLPIAMVQDVNEKKIIGLNCMMPLMAKPGTNPKAGSIILKISMWETNYRFFPTAWSEKNYSSNCGPRQLLYFIPAVEKNLRLSDWLALR
jgi:hypothetical protein